MMGSSRATIIATEHGFPLSREFARDVEHRR
jgi:hypothetical protein